MNNLRQAAQVALASMRQMLQSGEWYCAQERADALEAALAEPQPKPRREFLLLAEKCGAVLTGKGDGSESVTVVFTVNAWRAFDAALAEPQPVKWNELDALKDEYWNEPQPEPVAPPGYILVPESLAEPTEEMLQAFQKAFVQQLHRRRNKPSLESAERAGLRAMLKAGEKAEALQAQQHQSEPVAYGSDDGYWVRACDYQLRPDKERFTELFYAAPQAQAPQPEPVADAYNIDARIAAIAADRDYWREQATGPQSEPVPVAVVKSCVGRGSDGVRITWLAGFPQIGDRLYAKPKAQQPRFVKPWQERLPCSPMDCSSSEVVAAQQAEIDEWRNGQALQPQPEPYCYIYEYDSVLGLHREFYPRQWNGYLPSRVVTLYAAPTAQQPQPEPVALRAALMRLADAADRVGVEHFDSDSLPPAVDLLNTETRAVHTLLKQSAGPQPEPVAHIDLVQNPMRPSYFIAGAADEHPAEQVLRALACWLGVGGYNAQTVDAKVFHRKIVDGVEQLMKSRAAPQVQHPLTDEQINQCISADKAFWHTAAKETGWSFGPNLHDFARAIEAAHGIGGK